MKQTFEVNILNHKFTFKTDNDEERVKKVVDYVNKKIHEVASRGQVIPTTHVAVLAAVNMVEELFKREEELVQKIKLWSDKLAEVEKSLVEE